MRTTMTALYLASLWVTPAVGQAGNNTDVLNPNLAVEDELVGLPQIDAALAKLFDLDLPVAQIHVLYNREVVLHSMGRPLAEIVSGAMPGCTRCKQHCPD